MRISDWSSDVCSSDLIGDLVRFHPASQRPFRADREERARRLVLRDDGQGLRHRQARLRGHLVELELAIDRSEEHTSELQSLMRISYAVFCLKKSNITII